MTENNAKGSEIQTLTWQEAIRKRPGMYFGGTDSKALHQLAWEVVDNAINEVLRGAGNRIDVVLDDFQRLTITDNGAGMPIEPDQHTGRPTVEIVLTGARGWRPELQTKPYRTTLFRIGLAPVNAGSAELSVQIRCDGHLWEQHYREGRYQSDLKPIRPLLDGEPTGTTISLKPDFSVFVLNEFDYRLLACHLHELAFLVPGITIHLEDRRAVSGNRIVTFYYPDGVVDYVRHLNREYPVLHDPITIEKTVDLERNHEPMGLAANIGIALQFAGIHPPVLLGFVNAFPTEQGGTHVQGFVEALRRAITDYGEKMDSGEGNWYYRFIEDDITCGLAAVLSIWHPSPVWEGAARYRLMNPELERAVYDVTLEAFALFAEAHPDQMQHILEKCLKNRELRLRRQFGD